MSGQFVTTETILDRILARKTEEVAAHKAVIPLAQIEAQAAQAAPPRGFEAALNRETVALIAEVKHASPSKGVLIDPFDPVAIASAYESNGAACISVLTDEPFFGGQLDHLTAVRENVAVPVLRKDFIFDPYQIYEGRAAGADAMLLIVAALADAQLAELHALILDLGMSALVEVHNEAELERAKRVCATLIGVNNRDLKTFHEDLGTTERLAALLPDHATLVAESAIRSPEDVDRMGACGARAVLVGEGLVRSKDIGAQVRAFCGHPRTNRESRYVD